jgi:hypothetical protein
MQEAVTRRSKRRLSRIAKGGGLIARFIFSRNSRPSWHWEH